MLTETHKNQKTFSNIMEAFSYPGRLVSLEPSQSYRGNLYPYTIDLALCLLDGEVSLHVVDTDQVALQEIQIRTNVKDGSLEDADYVIFSLEKNDQVKDSLGRQKKGTLINPQLSATTIIEVEELSKAKDLVLTGPGIKDQNYLSIGKADWLDQRRLINEDFPLGLDILLVDKSGNLVALPRTTEIRVGE
ncbi:MAG: phosphonate C-P lyase system protein PhnH [Bacillota bacterium]|nr:phosphonate C-P lyase system protein PhnH [Bacillota bacterium]